MEAIKSYARPSSEKQLIQLKSELDDLQRFDYAKSKSDTRFTKKSRV
jgi:hypothetical protein